MKQKAINVGDDVILIDPRPIIQLDYDVNINTIAKEAGKEQVIIDFIRQQKLDSIATERLLKVIASSRLKLLDKSGRKRVLVLGEPIEKHREQTFSILNRIVKYTGKYNRGYSTGYYDEQEYEPPYLSSIKAIVCYQLWSSFSIDSLHWPYYGFWVTRDQVKRVS